MELVCLLSRRLESDSRNQRNASGAVGVAFGLIRIDQVVGDEHVTTKSVVVLSYCEHNARRFEGRIVR
jgi:hypothetical protein